MHFPWKVLDSTWQPRKGTSTHNRPFRLRNRLKSHDPKTNPGGFWTAVLVAFLRWNLFTYRDLWDWLDHPFEVLPVEPQPVQDVLPLEGLGQHLATQKGNLDSQPAILAP